MYDIKIINLKDYSKPNNGRIYLIDRRTAVGNPFIMDSESNEERNRVCDEYQKYFYNKIDEFKLNSTRTLFIDYLITLYKVHQFSILNLGCHCSPLRCHGETIKEFLESNDAHNILGGL